MILFVGGEGNRLKGCDNMVSVFQIWWEIGNHRLENAKSKKANKCSVGQALIIWAPRITRFIYFR